ncbi:hypothetical protein Ciccas_005956 [Cichlidogyrus casuarinus]|uniref:Uncharacterized protein n=1 Tax=Cichlidogyrus casuarinus TaxID=1844966 RepID=A0ABD2QAX3_9PLAT
MRYISIILSNHSSGSTSLITLSKIHQVPSWLVDLRNDIAHGSMPAFCYLKNAFEWCINHIRLFWSQDISTGSFSDIENPFPANQVEELFRFTFNQARKYGRRFSVLENAQEQFSKLNSYFDKTSDTKLFNFVYSLQVLFECFVKKNEEFNQNFALTPLAINVFYPIVEFACKKFDLTAFIAHCLFCTHESEYAKYYTRLCCYLILSISDDKSLFHNFVQPIAKSLPLFIDYLIEFSNEENLRLLKLVIDIYEPLTDEKRREMIEIVSFLKNHQNRPKENSEVSDQVQIWELAHDVPWHNLPLGTCL